MPVTNYYSVNGVIIAEHTTGQSRLDYVTDALGSVIATVDQTLTVKSTARYKPYGANLAQTGTQPMYGWVGSPGCRRTELPHSEVYARARVASTSDGRWTTVDPLWPHSQAYLYALANPSTLIDPSGLEPSGQSKGPSGGSGCDPALLSQLNAGKQAICSGLQDGKSLDQATVNGLVQCALKLMPRNCKNYYTPPTDRLQSCMKAFCVLDLNVDCKDQSQCQKGDCAYTTCRGTIYGIPLGFTVCTAAQNCKGKPGIPPSCQFGSGSYGIKGGGGLNLPPGTEIVLHELMHSCTTCGSPPKKNKNSCDEAFTQALAVCIANLIGGK